MKYCPSLLPNDYILTLLTTRKWWNIRWAKHPRRPNLQMRPCRCWWSVRSRAGTRSPCPQTSCRKTYKVNKKWDFSEGIFFRFSTTPSPREGVKRLSVGKKKEKATSKGPKILHSPPFFPRKKDPLNTHTSFGEKNGQTIGHPTRKYWTGKVQVY